MNQTPNPTNSSNQTPNYNYNLQISTNSNCNNISHNKPEIIQNKSQANNTQNMANSINNLIKNNRESKDYKTTPKNTSTSALTINHRQHNTYNKNNAKADINDKKIQFSLLKILLCLIQLKKLTTINSLSQFLKMRNHLIPHHLL